MTAGRADGRTAGWSWMVGLVGVLLVALASSALAQDADSREIAAFRLTDATLAKFIRASRAMAAVAKATPADTTDADDESESSPAIAEIAAFYDANPAARRAITGAGLTTREYVVFTFALFQAGMGAWLVEQQGWSKLPPDFARANVEFYQRHKAQLDSLTADLKNRTDTEP
jgi:hypothetical protein